MFRFVLFDLR